MERVGVSKSLLGTYDQHWDLPVILPLTMMQNAKSWLCFRFLFFTSAASKFSQNAVTSTDASLRADVPISTAACVFTRWLVLPTTWPLECHTGETSYHAQQMWISIANCGYAKVSVLTENLRDFGIWVFICFQQLSMVPVWTLKALFRNLSVRWNSPALAKIK